MTELKKNAGGIAQKTKQNNWKSHSQNKHSVHKFENEKKKKNEARQKKNPWQGVIGDGVYLDL